VHLVGTTAALIGVTTALPQLRRLIRSADVAGLSLLSNVLGALSAATWLSYGLWLVDGPQLVANVPGTLGGTAIVVLVVIRSRRTPWWLLALPVGWATVAAGAAVLGGVGALGLAATAIGTASRVPQVWTAFASDELGGLSLSSQWLALASATLWFGYGAGSRLTPVMISSVCAILLIVGVLVAALRASRRTAAATPAASPAGTGDAVRRVPAQRVPHLAVGAPAGGPADPAGREPEGLDGAAPAGAPPEGTDRVLAPRRVEVQAGKRGHHTSRIAAHRP
jgi:uncharacterized protein with PQ loop repeat